MELIDNWGQQAAGLRPRTVVTLGVFDGLHLGHQAIICSAVKSAAKLKAQSLVLTFDPHPLRILAKNAAPPLLTTVRQKAEVMAALGLNRLGVLRFTWEMAATEPLKFLNLYLAKFIEPAAVLLGPDFSFGKDARGGAKTIRAWLHANTPKASLTVVEPIGNEQGIFASSQIRQNLKDGLVENAALALGRPYRLAGRVVHGLARGRQLGFPTANLGQTEQLIPGPGVYATRVVIEGITYGAMTSIGYNPTFGEKSQTVETNIFDFDRFIYDRELSLDFVARLRTMINFDSVEQLVRQLEQDRETARRLHGRLNQNF
jgi:riboflavin kinase/FMN adenylyltransferase